MVLPRRISSPLENLSPPPAPRRYRPLAAWVASRSRTPSAARQKPSLAPADLYPSPCPPRLPGRRSSLACGIARSPGRGASCVRWRWDRPRCSPRCRRRWEHPSKPPLVRRGARPASAKTAWPALGLAIGQE